MEIARAVAADLRTLYGARLRRVVLFGSWARGDAPPESDIDLLVVLDWADSPWEELRRMDEILWRHSYRNDALVTAVPVGVGELGQSSSPLLIRVHLLVRDGHVDQDIGRLLRSLFERRNEADCSPVDVPAEEADAAIRDAERVVNAIQLWLTQRLGAQPPG